MSMRISLTYTCDAPGCFDGAQAQANKLIGIREVAWGKMEDAGWCIIEGRHYCLKHRTYHQQAAKGQVVSAEAIRELLGETVKA